jgi:hypothetical protein
LTWKRLSPSFSGDAQHLGGDDYNKIVDYLTGSLDVDTVDINSLTKYRNLKFAWRNPANTFSYTLSTSAISADRTITLPQLANSDSFVFEAHTQQLTNKIIDAILQSKLKRFQLLPSVKRSSYWAANGTANGGFSGWGPYWSFTLRSSQVGTSAAQLETTTAFSSTHGYGTIFATGTGTANSKAGWVFAGGVPFSITQWNPIFKFKFAIPASANTRLQIGFSSNATIPVSDTLLSNTDSGVLVGYRSTGDTNFMVFNNDGSGAMVATSTGVAIDTAVHVVEIAFDNSVPNCVIKIDGNVTNTITTRLPASTTTMIVHHTIETTTTSSVSMTGYWAEYEADN